MPPSAAAEAETRDVVSVYDNSTVLAWRKLKSPPEPQLTRSTLENHKGT